MLSKIVGCVAVAALAVVPVGMWAQAAPAAAPVAQSAVGSADSALSALSGLHYRYWPEQIVQWIGPELPYSMIVLDVDDRGKQPVYDVELIDKSGKEIVHYTNSAMELALDQRIGFDVHQVAMKLDGPADPEKGGQYMLRFNTEKGVPVVWQFVLGTDVSEQGSGVNPVAAGPVSLLIYREQGGLAGQGTALQVGSVTSTAAEWTELAQPPYFVPYRGALSVGSHVLSFAPGGPAMKAGPGVSITHNGDTVTVTNDALGVTAEYTLDANHAVSRVTFGPVKAKSGHTVNVEFTPPLTAGGKSKFEVVAGKKSKIAEGTVEAKLPGGAEWMFTKPEALKRK